MKVFFRSVPQVSDLFYYCSAASGKANLTGESSPLLEMWIRWIIMINATPSYQVTITDLSTVGVAVAEGSGESHFSYTLRLADRMHTPNPSPFAGVKAGDQIAGLNSES